MFPMGKEHKSPARGVNRIVAGKNFHINVLEGPVMTIRMMNMLLMLIATQLAVTAASKDGEDTYRTARERMVRTQVKQRGVRDADVLEAMRTVPRHRLVPPVYVSRAYRDTPLPIGHGQTISQPYIVGLMTELLEVDSESRILEVGTGSGYQAAVLSRIVKEVVTVEIIKPLADRARGDLRDLGYSNITVIHADGYYGQPGKGPFDAIIVTAAAEHIPPPLIEQLKPGGRTAIPVGRMGWTQNLVLLVKDARTGKVTTKNILPVTFVPLTRADK